MRPRLFGVVLLAVGLLVGTAGCASASNAQGNPESEAPVDQAFEQPEISLGYECGAVSVALNADGRLYLMKESGQHDEATIALLQEEVWASWLSIATGESAVSGLIREVQHQINAGITADSVLPIEELTIACAENGAAIVNLGY